MLPSRRRGFDRKEPLLDSKYKKTHFLEHCSLTPWQEFFVAVPMLMVMTGIAILIFPRGSNVGDEFSDSDVPGMPNLLQSLSKGGASFSHPRLVGRLLY